MNSRLPILALCFSSIGWGLTWIPIKGINQLGLATPHLILIAFSSGAIALLPWIIKQRQQWLPILHWMLALALLGGFANVAFQTAIAEGDVVRVMILFYMLPLWSALGGRLFLKEPIDSRRGLALALCIMGAFAILEAWTVSLSQFSWVDLMAIGAGMGLAGSNILFRFTAKAPLASKIGFMFLGCIVLIALPLLLLPNTIEKHTQWLAHPLVFDYHTIGLAVAYGLIWLMLITFASQWAVTRIEAARSAVILVLELVAAAVSVVLITQSSLAAHELIGGAMVIAAAIIEGSREEAAPLKG